MKVQLTRTQTGFVPHSAHDEERLKGVRMGDVVMADIKKSRNPEFHKLAFSMLNLSFENQDHFDNFDKYREYLQCEAGIAETLIGPDGKMFYKLKSLAWQKMDELEFQQAFQALLTAAVEKMGQDWLLERYG